MHLFPNRQTCVSFLRPGGRGSRAMTFIELLMAVIIFALIGIVVTWLTVLAAHASKSGINLMSSESRARYALETLRRKLLPAQIGSVVITDASSGSQIDRRIQYFDPAANDNTGATSELRFRKSDATYTNNGVLIYDQDIAETDNLSNLTVRDLYNVDFQFPTPTDTNTVNLEVETLGFLIEIAGSTPTADELKRMRIMTVTDQIRLRNVILP